MMNVFDKVENIVGKGENGWLTLYHTMPTFNDLGKKDF